MKKNVVYPVRLEPVQLEAIKIIAEKEGVSAAVVARWALEEYITRYFSKKKNKEYLDELEKNVTTNTGLTP